MTTDAPLSIRKWSLAARREPVVRIGVVLAEDGLQTLRARIPADGPFELSAGAQPLARPHAGEELTFTLAGDLVQAARAAAPVVTARSLRLAPAAPVPLKPAGGILVHDVVAGRGFHWQKRIDQTLAGAIEIHAAAGGLILVNELGLEDYLAGVITAEMSGACPADLLKAQCVVARSWLLAMTEPKHTGEPYDRCNDDCCQRYQGTGDVSPIALAATRDTRGVVLLAPTGIVLDANYAKSCGGISETPVAVWGLEKPGISAVVDAPADAPERRFFPITDANLDEYLDGAWVKSTTCFCSPNVVPVADIGRYLGRVDTTDDYFRWSVTYPRGDLEALLRDKLTDARDLAELRDLRVRARGVSGRAYVVEVDWLNGRGELQHSRLESEYRIRQVLHRKFLYSSAFAIRPQRDADGRLSTVTLRGAGWGHGVGLCQIGALGMALRGYDYESICRHYYPTSSVQTGY